MAKYTGKLGELYTAYSRVVSLWPVDKLRPTHCYKKELKQQMGIKFDRLSSMHGTQLNQELGRIEQEITALNNLVTNKYRLQYKVSEAITNPASNRNYYTKLLESIDKAAVSGKKNSLRVD
ncbi:hypothetical protein COEREDRAFT_79892 [Coemansia reversa NRRL 1564]|uniref:Uncharacterized protein n=1 Tax=Coemansia reversa (strain ATCC 12441 / NRRL 1564) TaxID=763665 RepID=A0A2G5BI52_COERN|nr:hypothetical protein COEREDRAFT_79892 [Coemansia reversa NRRL 1564]|eukprot:PIA18427.1 hypothetical protein COEREDRAFT_79892 [Coemansia reversa NRRL 1564]